MRKILSYKETAFNYNRDRDGGLIGIIATGIIVFAGRVNIIQTLNEKQLITSATGAGVIEIGTASAPTFFGSYIVGIAFGSGASFIVPNTAQESIGPIPFTEEVILTISVEAILTGELEWGLLYSE